MAIKDQSTKTLVRNKKARHDYFIEDTFEAGIELKGTEVKSAREQRMNLTDCYARVDNGELWLVGLHISPYKQGNMFNHEPARTRKLLMHKHEIERLRKQRDEKGMTIVPLSLYLKNGRIKVEIAIAKGKHLYDKRQDNASRDANREMARAMKRSVQE